MDEISGSRPAPLMHMSVGRWMSVHGSSWKAGPSTLRRNQILIWSSMEALGFDRVQHIGILQTAFG